jgi:general secretion pathway protein K
VKKPRGQPGPAQKGAAILTAMLLVTLVASLSAAALWQQWRGIEVETAERARLQSGWILQGALDWARLILREDARAGTTDHLAEPWAVPLQEARLSTFLAVSPDSADPGDAPPDAFLSGRISDLQARLNVLNLVQDGRPHLATVKAFSRLFASLQIPENQLIVLVNNLKLALDAPAATSEPMPVPLLPRSVEQLAWLGLSDASIALLRPFVTMLPERTAVNLNTAPAVVLYACIEKLTMADAQRLVAARALTHFKTLTDVATALGASETRLIEGEHSVQSRYFEVFGQLRLDTRLVHEHSVMRRDGLIVTVLWRERGTQSASASVQ